MVDKLSAALEQVTKQLEERQKEFVIRSTEWTQKTRERLKAQTVKLEEKRNRLQGLLVSQYDRMDRRMNRDAKTVQLRDKISFVVGVGNACVAPVVAIRYPQHIPVYYSVQIVILLLLRYVIYRSKRWHYFVFDMCYFANLMTLLLLWAWPGSVPLLIATFAMTNGPVAWAIITWRNSLVFHSLDKVTSVFIHIFPPLVCYCLRWMPNLLKDFYCDNHQRVTDYRDRQYPAFQALHTVPLTQLVLYSTLAYALWQALYYVFIMVGQKQKVDAGLRLTSYSWLLNDTQGKRGFIQKSAFFFGERYKLPMFMLLQLVYHVVTAMPTYFLYRHFWLHTTFLIAMFAVSVWNGANYYIEVFSRRYITELDRIQPQKQA
ncbi:hypothetical protein BY458DRAFT_526548 [Sporodiniella umbellata]|nr:hypothetical protein BY458DRAFT_526548 [Sporodiniella umbellata]